MLPLHGATARHHRQTAPLTRDPERRLDALVAMVHLARLVREQPEVERLGLVRVVLARSEPAPNLGRDREGQSVGGVHEWVGHSTY